MNRKIEIDYRWNLVDYPNLSYEQEELLKEHAEERIFDM
jgi:hypothetical protein